MNTLAGGLRIQRRVVWALMLRETKTLFGRHKLGYLWALINASFAIGVFWFIREAAGFHAPHGFSNPAFLLGGFIPFFLFSETLGGALNAIGGNRALLGYPQVFPLDILLARTLLKGAMYVCVFVILALVANGIGQEVPVDEPMTVLFALLLALALGLGVGSLCSSLNLMWPTTGRIVPMTKRFLFFTSGLFFSVENAPPRLRTILFFNPLSHLIELTRDGLSGGYESHFVHLPYVGGFVLVSLAAGLLLERYSRRYLDEAA